MQPLPMDAHFSDPEADSALEIAGAPAVRPRAWPLWSLALCMVAAVVLFVAWRPKFGNDKVEMLVGLDLVKDDVTTSPKEPGSTTPEDAASTTTTSGFKGEGAMIRLRDPTQCMELFDTDPATRHGGKTARAHRCPEKRCSYQTCMSFSFTGTGEIRLGNMCLDAPRLQFEVQFWPCASVKYKRHTKFSLEDDGRVRLMANRSRCLSVFDETKPNETVSNGAIQMGPILELRDCNSNVADKWSVEGRSGYIAGARLK